MISWEFYWTFPNKYCIEQLLIAAYSNSLFIDDMKRKLMEHWDILDSEAKLGQYINKKRKEEKDISLTKKSYVSVTSCLKWFLKNGTTEKTYISLSHKNTRSTVDYKRLIAFKADVQRCFTKILSDSFEKLADICHEVFCIKNRLSHKCF